ncbi:uncharacterized protein LOC112154824 [Oryzias melastigma]|uniref:uncharacterized protein LOC112154824 n=1 Tax=Oryzias melastigma TaxID=30732 RepID=UPI00168D8E99|nr:uncharacterized protein LOC112154824 [Oryzias melastigma]
MEPKPVLTTDTVRPPSRACTCGNKIAGADTHSACASCLGLQHAQDALASPVTCEHCARLSTKTRKRRLSRQVSLSAVDPMMGVAIPPPPELTDCARGNSSPMDASWGDQLDAAAPLSDHEEPYEAAPPEQHDAAGAESDSEDESISLGSEEDEEDCGPFIFPAAAKPTGLTGTRSGSPNPTATVDLHDVCRRAAAKLGVEWPETPTETPVSRYEGKRLPKAKSPGRQLLPVFPECLEEATRSWSNPLTAKNPTFGNSALDWAGMEENGFAHIPPVEPLLASHLHPTQKPSMTSASPALPSKSDGFQSTLTDKGYRAVASSVKALNASSLLLAYQAEIQEQMSASPTSDLWDELCVVTDLCLRLHRSAVQAAGRAMALMVTQERARWLNLSSLSQKEKTHLLDVPVDPKGLFGPAVATMQKRCEEKKREGEALQLCLPRKALPLSAAPRQTFAQAVARPAFRIPRRQPQPQSDDRGHGKPTELKAPGTPRKRDVPPETLSTGRRSGLGQTPALTLPHNVLFCSTFKPSKRRAEDALALPAHSQLKRRKTGPAESSVEPQLRSVNAHKSTSTHQCKYVLLLNKMCSIKTVPCACLSSMHNARTRGQENTKRGTERYEPAQLHMRLRGGTPPAPLQPRCLGTSSARPVHAHSALLAHFPKPPHLGPLSANARAWRDCGASSWVMKTVTRGYRLQFAFTPPRFNGILHSQAHGERARILQAEIAALMNKNAIQPVPPAQSADGFYSRYFLVPKRDGGLRPILDLRALNKYLRQYTFRMLTHAALMRFVRQGDWFISIDLKDAYFHIPIYPPHRKYLRFAFQGKTYEYVVLPFGLSLSPRVFVKCTEAAIAPLRERGMRLATYIDDWLLAAQSPRDLSAHAELLTSHLIALGFTINWDKSVLIPAQTITFIGLSLDSKEFRARLSADRLRAFRACLALFRRGACLRFRQCLRLLGLMASALIVVPLGRLYMRPFQRWVASLNLSPARHAHRRVHITVTCAVTLHPWRSAHFLTRGVTMGTIQTRKIVTTDASLTGWGATHEGMTVNGSWSSHMQSVHINCLELLAVSLALKHFLPRLRGEHVLVRTDNTTVVAYINKQGGLRSRRLHTLAHRLIVWSSSHLLSLRAIHVPGIMNRAADLLSRGNPRYREWKLHSDVVAQIWTIYGRAEIDLFASAENAQCPKFYSLTDQGLPLGLDALAHEWPKALLYAFPPLELIPPTLARVRGGHHSLILIAPRWPGKPWLAEIFQLMDREPWPLPLRRDLLSQARGEIFHPHPGHMALWAWPVRG